MSLFIIEVGWVTLATAPWYIVLGLTGSAMAAEYQQAESVRDAAILGAFSLAILGLPLAVVELAVYGLLVAVGVLPA